MKVFSQAVPIMTAAAMIASLCYGALSHEALKLKDQEPYDPPIWHDQCGHKGLVRLIINETRLSNSSLGWAQT